MFYTKCSKGTCSCLLGGWPLLSLLCYIVQDHRITERLGLEGPLKPIRFHPCHGWTPSLQQVAQGLVHPGLEHLQDWAPPSCAHHCTDSKTAALASLAWVTLENPSVGSSEVKTGIKTMLGFKELVDFIPS